MDFLLNPHLKASVKPQLTSDVHLFQQLVRHAPHYFPELQRQLQLEVAMTPFELLSCFARDCTQVFDYPRSEFMQYLLSYSTFMTEDTATSTVAQCRCGSRVLCIESPTMSEALVSQRSTCQTSDQERQRARGEQLNE
ncbi:hypothetical protein PR003_g30504 [Phytophthora rubi]|uniref:Uncharacterized protein n=1 Tax=Phytophthora rubi TaxID=129364 RepID=A0A6A4BDQ4_9STRA|nr:hypothetical protein PR003_g30504 [Phytophthora rubi]